LTGHLNERRREREKNNINKIKKPVIRSVITSQDSLRYVDPLTHVRGNTNDIHIILRLTKVFRLTRQPAYNWQ
jgi:hypothetical protein